MRLHHLKDEEVVLADQGIGGSGPSSLDQFATRLAAEQREMRIV
jgi:hypothetical protein